MVRKEETAGYIIMQVLVMSRPLVGQQLANTCWWDHKVPDYQFSLHDPEI